MNRRELNNLIKEELEAAVKGHPSYLEEVEDMEAGEAEGGEGEEEDIMDALQGFYEKLKVHFEGEGEAEDEGGEEKTEEEEEKMEDEEEAPEDVEEAKRGRKKSKDEKEEILIGKENVKGIKFKENTLNESIKRFQKLANIRG